MCEHHRTDESRNEARYEAEKDNISEFRNVYVLPPPGVMLRDRSKRWFDIPWRVARSFEVSDSRCVQLSWAHPFKGFKFIVDHYTGETNPIYRLQDRELEVDLYKNNWEARAWPGMIVEMSDASALEVAVLEQASPTNITASTASTSLPTPCLYCFLCKKEFGSHGALSRHTSSSHLVQRPWPPDQ